MKKLLLILFAFTLFGGMVLGQTTIHSESFESAPNGSSTDYSIDTEFGGSDANDYFQRITITGNGKDEINTGVTGGDGSYMIAGEDIDGSTPTPKVITIVSVSVSGYSSISVTAAFGSGEQNKYDEGDYIKLFVKKDGGSEELIAAFYGYDHANNDGINGRMYEDENLDGSTSDNSTNMLSKTLTDYTYSISGVSSTLQVILKLTTNSGDEVLMVDNVRITGISGSSVNNPTDFIATTNSTSQIDLSWTQNGNSDDVMVAWSSDGIFGTPTDGTSYSAGNSITGGGTVLYNGSATSYNHTGLTAGTQYYYKAWSVDGSDNYSSGVTDDATTYKNEPSNQVNSFTATGNGATTIDLSWVENDGAVAADGYLIVANIAAITDPVDGTDPADDTDLTDGAGNVKVAHGTTSYSFTNCSSSTTYNFKIYAYTNSGSAIDFNVTDPPSDSGTTGAPAVEPDAGDLLITEVNSASIANSSYVEIYNTTLQELTLDKVDLEFYNNGAGSSTTTIELSGNISAGSYIVVARTNASFNTTYGFNADFEDSDLFLNGGADGLVLRHDDNGILDYFNDAPSPSVSWTDNHLFYRFIYSSDGSHLNIDWDDSGKNKNGTPRAPNALTWVTTGTSDWGTGSNWDNGDKPSKGVDVVIPSGGTQPTVDGSAASPEECMDLTINASASLTIDDAGFLTVHGVLVNNGTFTINSTTTSTGSLIENSGIAVTMQRYVSAWINNTRGWHLLSSPVASQNIQPEFVPNPPTADEDFYKLDETASSENWINTKDNSGNWNSSFESTFGVGTGYLVAYKTAQTKSFSGITNHLDVSKSGLSYTAVSAYIGWHLLGNPYPSALRWNQTSWGLTNIDGIAKIWDESSASYTDIAAGGTIPQTQGFMIHVNNTTGGSLVIDATDRIHSATNWYKTEAADNSENTLKLTAYETENNTAQESIIRINANATEEFDTDFDSHFLTGYAPRFYSVLEDGTALSTNTIPSISSKTIPFSFIKNSASEFYIKVEGIESFENNVTVYLTDLKTNISQKLNDNPIYHFTSSEGDINERFELHFGPVGINDNINVNNDINVFTRNGQIEIRSKNPLNGTVMVYNITGQLMLKTAINNQNSASINTGNFKGIAIVSVVDEKQVYNQKILIK
jgi:hypothetical protein